MVAKEGVEEAEVRETEEDERRRMIRRQGGGGAERWGGGYLGGCRVVSHKLV